MSKQHLVLALFVFGAFGCSEPSQVALEFRIAEEEPAPGLTEMVFDDSGRRFYLHDEVVVDRSHVESAVMVMQNGRPAVEVVLTAPGARKFEALTEANVGKRCGMVVNGELVSAPRIMAPIRGGRAIVSGDFTEAEARDLAKVLSQPQSGGTDEP